MKLLYKVFLVMLILFGGFLVIEGIMCVSLIICRNLFRDYVADLIPLIIIPIGLSMICFAKRKYDRLGEKDKG